MSKRSSRRKRQAQQKKQEAKLTGPVLTNRGKQAFQQANYEAAIADWEKARQKKETTPKLAGALAEAYFRRAVSSPVPNVADLQQAVRLRPEAPQYQYHLALAHHRAGHLDQAEPIYRELLAATPPFVRAAGPLAQLVLEQKKPLNKDPVMKQLDPAVKTQLVAAEALVKKKAASTLKKLSETDLEPLWQGLVALALKDEATAQTQLQTALDTDNLHPQAASVAHYYLGVLASAEGQSEAAGQQWQKAQANGLDTYHLQMNRDILHYHQLLAAQQAGHPAQALEILPKIYWKGGVGISSPNRLERQLHWELADAAVQKGDWEQALTAWQNVQRMGEDSRPLAFNLALAYQKTEHFWKAAEQWRVLLRRRPRKPDHPDYLTDEQVVRIWQNVADNYNQAGDYEEAIKTYKTAIKWGPDKLDLRLRLAEALQAAGRWQASENELNRILEKDPDHVPALLALAESYAEGYWQQHQARRLLLRAFELEPQNPIVRQQLAFLFERQSLADLQWGQSDRALEILQEGLDLLPNHQRLLLVTGTVYFSMQDIDTGRDYLEQAVTTNPNDLQTLHTIYLTWLRVDSAPDLAKTLAHIKAVQLPIPGDFFLDLITHCLEMEQEEQATELIDYAESRYQEDVQTMLTLASLLHEMEEDKRALVLLRRILKEHPNHAEANLHLGTVYFDLDQTRLAKRHWDKAEQLARQENDQMLLYQLKTIRDVRLHGKQPPQNIAQMFQQMPPALRDQLLEDAPPEIAAMLKDMPPEMVELMMNMAMGGDMDMDPFDLFDEDDEDDDGWF